MGLLDNFRRKRAIKSYIKMLPRVLVKDYGKSEHYTPQQIRRSIERSKLNSQYVHYALVMYVLQPEFVFYQQEMDQSFDYEELRAEIGNDFFEGDTEFNYTSITSLSSSFAGESSSIDVSGGGDGGSG